MKSHIEILKEISANAESIKAKTAEIEKLSCIYERRTEANAGNYDKVKEYRETMKANTGKIEELKKEIETAEIVNRYLLENDRAARVAEVLPVLKEVFTKYNGKKYGPKTRDAIRAEFNARNYSAYPDGINIAFEELVNGFTHCNSLKLYGLYTNPIITKENTINAAALDDMRNPHTYTENPAEAAAAILAKYEEVQKAFTEAKKAAEEYNELIISGLKAQEPPKVNTIY